MTARHALTGNAGGCEASREYDGSVTASISKTSQVVKANSLPRDLVGSLVGSVRVYKPA